MTDKDKKLAEEILVKRGFFVMTHKEGSEHVRKVFIDPVIEAMQEYAELWHTAKMQEVTDEDIEERFLKEEPRGYGCSYYAGMVKGAKAMRDGEIKHK